MRNCIYLLCLAPALAYSDYMPTHAPDHDRGKKVEWFCNHYKEAKTLLFEAYGERTICGVRYDKRGSYLVNRDNLTANDYDNVLVIYTVRDNRRHDHRENGHNIAIGIAHQFSEYRLSEVTIEQFDQSRSRVIDVDDILGVALSYNSDYYGKSLNESVLHQLSEEWQQRFPTDNGQVYKFSGSVELNFSDNNVLFQVREVSRENKDPRPFPGLPPVLVSKDYLID